RSVDRDQAGEIYATEPTESGDVRGATDGETPVNLSRRTLLLLAAAAAPLPAIFRTARAQAYPSRPVRIVVGQSGGSGTDTGARRSGQGLPPRPGQPFVVETPRAPAGNTPPPAVVRAPADGYTLGTVISANAINETLYDNLSFSFVRDIAPV